MEIAVVPGEKGKYTYFLKVIDAQKQWGHYILTVAGDNDFMKPFFNSIKLTWAYQVALSELSELPCLTSKKTV